MAEKPRDASSGKHRARAFLGRSPLKGEHDLDRWREQGACRVLSGYRSHGLGPLLLQLYSSQPGTSRTTAVVVSRYRVPVSAFLEHPIKSRFLGPTHPIQNLSVGPGGEVGGLYFLKLPGDCTFRVERWYLIALYLLFPLAGSPSFSFSTSLNFRLGSHVSVQRLF